MVLQVDHLVDVLRRTASLERHFDTDTALHRDTQALHTSIAAHPRRPPQRPLPAPLAERTEEIASASIGTSRPKEARSAEPVVPS
jgi:hypothetical protein